MAIEQRANKAFAKEIATELVAEIEFVINRHTKTCLTCEHWFDERDVNANTCGKFNALPPPRVIAYGCPDYSEEIPF
jgi:hypothetical protein